MNSPAAVAAGSHAQREEQATRPPLQRTRVGMISLGCAKNLVDAEIMIGSVLQRGMEITSRAEDADVLVINTCAFIDSAKEESIEAILEAHQQRGLNKRTNQKLIVSGCMSQRFSSELREALPEVDAFIGLDQVSQLGEIVEKIVAQDCILHSDEDASYELAPLFIIAQPRYIPDYDTPRFRLTPSHTAYVKIAEGCNHPCSFCVIPQMRGKHRSRQPESVLAEIRALVAEGVREINLISQDTTYYGMDLWPAKAGPRQPIDSNRGPTLASLLREIQQIEGEFWVRLLYTHPAHWSDELIETIAACNKVARYVDIPLQHIDDSVLWRMRRETSRAHIERLIDKLRAGIPGIALRTTFIVGFPGETETEFKALLSFIRNTRFERLGVFKYSQEDGSRAAKLPNRVPLKIKNARYRRAMSIQREIAYEIAREKVGSELQLLVDQPHVARSEADAPDVDTRVVLSKAASVGEFVRRKISGTRGYDLLA
ncbi:MAG: 30S ribosomal protein S12 methylthiotransferase RimO [Verrucomicrobia bacterium]|nr:MAG: 30S ribosomal protein S12 methylthiotransferase RimO [Verrucomicrobiota bacterium]PYK36341.1 MAG: 30S ribosomal protein S12 methylthiotransferase RimO [Verrucomicrobiota bacterium]PYL20910.1 MAG: 30S ribosomal protein S12 methylthiotransferase RimO [Verrucomicrobiota bacterium]